MQLWLLLSDIVILLGASLLLGGVFSRFGHSPLLGYLLAGMALGGPGSINAVRSQQTIEFIADLGASLLLFSIGLEFSWSKLKKLGAGTLLAGTFQVLLTTFLGGAVGCVAGLGVRQALAVGAMVSLSSTAVVLRVLMERGETDGAAGRSSIAVLLVQDVAVVPLALLVTLLGGGGSPIDVALSIGRTVMLAGALIIALYVLLNMLAVRALGTLTLERNRELTIILAVVTGLGSAGGAHAAGISPALGAFIAGMFLGSSSFATQIRADVAPLRVVLLTLFFGAAGMVADPYWILQNAPLVFATSVVLIICKTAVLWAVLQALGQPAPVAAASGISLAQIGEFAFVLGSIGRANGVLTNDVYLLIVSVAIVTLLASPLILPSAPLLGIRLASWLRLSPSTLMPKGSGKDDSPDVVIVGFGPAGQIAARTFQGRPERVLVIDLNREGVQKARELGFEAHVGDATQIDVLEHARITSAKAVVVTVPHHRSAIHILEQVRRLVPHAHVVVRSRYQQDAGDFALAGAHAVVGDEEETGAGLGRHLREWLAASDERAPGPQNPERPITRRNMHP